MRNRFHSKESIISPLQLQLQLTAVFYRVFFRVLFVISFYALMVEDTFLCQGVKVNGPNFSLSLFFWRAASTSRPRIGPFPSFNPPHLIFFSRPTQW